MLIGHVQCGLHLEACSENVETSWVVRDRLFGASVARKYGRTLYWATRTLVLLGYDDVTPVSTAETLYVVFVVIMGALFGSSLLANFLFLFRVRNARFAAYSTHVDNAREYMRFQNIPRSVRQQVTEYFNYSWNTHRSLDSEEALKLLPQHLQSKVITTLRANRIAQVCFLMKESVELINELALALDRRVYSPGDLIIEPKVNAQMFFVIRGQVVVCSFTGAKPNECKTGDFFAEMCLLFPEMYLQKAIAKTFCEMYVLTKAKFDEALAEYHHGREKEVRLRMAETLERYMMQLRKTKKILGLQDGFENLSGRASLGRFSVGRSSKGRSKSSLARSITSLGRSSVGKGTTSATNAREWKNHTHWRYPGSSFRMLWDTTRLVSIVYVGFEVPYFAVFISMTEGRHMFVVDSGIDLRYAVTMLVEVFFTLDLILRSRYFAYMDHSVMLGIVRPDLIFAAYKSNGFFLDLLAWLPVGVVLDSLPTDSFQIYSSIIRLLRLLRLRSLRGLMQDLVDLYGASSKLHLVVSLVLGVSLMLHIVGCAWFEMALYPPDSESAHANSAFLISELTRSDCLKQATQFQNCSWVKFDCYAHIGIDFPQQNPDSTYQANLPTFAQCTGQW
ncbi:cGMP-gated cation channel alpha-1 [Phytophthora ramorum]|uniref:cGMP-gated cation channel alpha-1 n=1 Tax=Phytophthora ramorum TaxID=164328 RepID=UPI0030A03C76|nr:cGMP-gated cation channel alpha-1 [Phytophthora ramorum]